MTGYIRTHERPVVAVEDIGDEETGPYWVCRVIPHEKLLESVPAQPTAKLACDELWRIHGGDLAVLISRSRCPIK